MMFGALKNLLSGKTVILASASPRRQQLLQNIVCVCVCANTAVNKEELHNIFLQNFPVEVVPSQFEETLDKTTFLQPWRQVVVCHVSTSPIKTYVSCTGMQRRLQEVKL